MNSSTTASPRGPIFPPVGSGHVASGASDRQAPWPGAARFRAEPDWPFANDDRLKIGVVLAGADGQGSDDIVAGLIANDHVKIVAVTRQPSRVAPSFLDVAAVRQRGFDVTEALAKKSFNVPGYETLEAMLEGAKRMAGVVIVGRHKHQASMAMMALNRGRNVLSRPLMARTPDKAAEMVALAKECRLVLGFGYPLTLRFPPESPDGARIGQAVAATLPVCDSVPTRARAWVENGRGAVGVIPAARVNKMEIEFENGRSEAIDIGESGLAPDGPAAARFRVDDRLPTYAEGMEALVDNWALASKGREQLVLPAETAVEVERAAFAARRSAKRVPLHLGWGPWVKCERRGSAPR